MSQNGTVVLDAIKELQGPATIKTIVDHIALGAGVTLDLELFDTVKETLDGGVRFGFLQKKGDRYFVTPLGEFCYSRGEDNNDDGTETNDALTEDQDVPGGSTKLRGSRGRPRSSSRRRTGISRRRSRSKH